MAVFLTGAGIPHSFFFAEWQVSDIASASYNFALNSNNYYESQNKGVHNSAALCRVNITLSEPCNVIVHYISSGEDNYDYGLLGEIDVAMSTSHSDDGTGVIKSCKGESSTSEKTYTYSNFPAGEHFIDMKFRKDGSKSEGNDSLQFTIEIQQIGG